MTLTATATQSTFNVVKDRLAMKDPAIGLLRELSNTRYSVHVQEGQPLEEFSRTLVSMVKFQPQECPKTLVFVDVMKTALVCTCQW